MTSTRIEKPFSATFVEAGAKVLLELLNTTDRHMDSVEILTIFLKEEEIPGGGPSRANIKFEDITCIPPNQKVVVSHRTWIDGKPADPEHDELGRLKIVPGGGLRPYVLD